MFSASLSFSSVSIFRSLLQAVAQPVYLAGLTTAGYLDQGAALLLLFGGVVLASELGQRQRLLQRVAEAGETAGSSDADGVEELLEVVHGPVP